MLELFHLVGELGCQGSIAHQDGVIAKENGICQGQRHANILSKTSANQVANPEVSQQAVEAGLVETVISVFANEIIS